MNNYDTLQYIISRTLYIGGKRYVNIHIYTSDTSETFKFADFRFCEDIVKVKRLLGFTQNEVQKLLQIVTTKKDTILSLSLLKGMLSVEKEDDLDFLEDNSPQKISFLKDL